MGGIWWSTAAAVALLVAAADGFLEIKAPLQRAQQPNMLPLSPPPRSPLPTLQALRAPKPEPLLEVPSFEKLTGLGERLRVLLEKEVELLLGFWDGDLKCFRLAATVVDRVSVTSTCFSLFSILDHYEAWAGVVGISEADPRVRVPLTGVRQALTNGRWTFDSFQTPIVMSAMLRLAAVTGEFSLPPEAAGKFSKGIRVLLENRLRLGMHGRRSKVSAYASYWNTVVFLQILTHGSGAGAVSAAAAAAASEIVSSSVFGEVVTAVEQALVVSADEICRQMAYHTAGDYTNFDVVKLAYSLLTHHRISSSSGCFNRGPSMLNNKVVQKALDIVFLEQQSDGLWAAGQPIYNPADSGPGVNGTEGVARVGADVGNSYAFTFDMLGSLLEVFADVPSLVGRYHVQMELSLRWAEDNMVMQVYDEMCDVQRRTVEGTVVRGWRSNHLQSDQNSGPLGWSTAQVLFTLARMRSAFKTCLVKDILAEFKGTVSTGSNTQPWRRLMDSSLYLGGELASFKETMASRLLLPLADGEGSPWAVLRQPRRGLPPAYSAILFGPPGTAKTTTAQAVAKFLGWNFLVVDTADFLADGMQNVAARMTYVFDKLKVLERTVILFDEIEEFCLDREDPKLAMESRMLTTAMLTQLNDLRRQQKSVFLVATNRIRSFDAAITRPGRIDLVLFLGTPSLDARKRRAREVLAAGGGGGGMQSFDGAAEADFVASFMERHWEDDLQFFNFSENEAFLASALALAVAGKLDEASLMKVLTSASATTTIRDAQRAEYVSSMRLSRL